MDIITKSATPRVDAAIQASGFKEENGIAVAPAALARALEKELNVALSRIALPTDVPCPRTEAAICTPTFAKFNPVVPATLSRQLEQELEAAQSQIRHLTELLETKSTMPNDKLCREAGQKDV